MAAALEGPAAAVHRLRAGPVSLWLKEGELRHLQVNGTELVQRVRARCLSRTCAAADAAAPASAVAISAATAAADASVLGSLSPRCNNFGGQWRPLQQVSMPFETVHIAHATATDDIATAALGLLLPACSRLGHPYPRGHRHVGRCQPGRRRVHRAPSATVAIPPSTR